MSCDELEDLLKKIKNNIVDQKNSFCQLYTIHSYKGLENNNIRIFDDIDKNNEENLYYVALTRGLKNIILDKNEIINNTDNNTDNNTILQHAIETDNKNIILLKCYFLDKIY